MLTNLFLAEPVFCKPRMRISCCHGNRRSFTVPLIASSNSFALGIGFFEMPSTANYIRIKIVDFGLLLQWPSLFNGHWNVNSG
jgi:hypothetical protein